MSGTVQFKDLQVSNKGRILGYSVPLPLLEGFFISVAAMSSGFAMLSKYDHINTYPDEFLDLGSNFIFGELFNSDWIYNKELLNLVPANLLDFNPPEEKNLDPKLDVEFTESIL